MYKHVPHFLFCQCVADADVVQLYCVGIGLSYIVPCKHEILHEVFDCLASAPTLTCEVVTLSCFKYVMDLSLVMGILKQNVG